MTGEQLHAILTGDDWKQRIEAMPAEKMAEVLEAKGLIPFEQFVALPDYTSKDAFFAWHDRKWTWDHLHAKEDPRKQLRMRNGLSHGS